MADLAYDESTHQLYIEYIRPSTIKQIGTTTMQTEAVPEDDDNDAAAVVVVVEDMELEPDNDADIWFDNGEMEEDDDNDDDGDDDGSGISI
jgi:hypothetical protein